MYELNKNNLPMYATKNLIKRLNYYHLVIKNNYITCNTKNLRYCVSSSFNKEGWSGACARISIMRTRLPLSFAASDSIFVNKGNVI